VNNKVETPHTVLKRRRAGLKRDADIPSLGGLGYRRINQLGLMNRPIVKKFVLFSLELRSVP